MKNNWLAYASAFMLLGAISAPAMAHDDDDHRDAAPCYAGSYKFGSSPEVEVKTAFRLNVKSYGPLSAWRNEQAYTAVGKVNTITKLLPSGPSRTGGAPVHAVIDVKRGAGPVQAVMSTFGVMNFGYCTSSEASATPKEWRCHGFNLSQVTGPTATLVVSLERFIF